MVWTVAPQGSKAWRLHRHSEESAENLLTFRQSP
jgi:hypothetical protein